MPDDLAVVRLDGSVAEGNLGGMSAEVVAMHTEVYRARPQAGAVIHTHPRHLLAFALAGRPLPVRYEPLPRLGQAEEVPVAPAAPVAPSDVRERRYWDDYQQAFEAMLSQTSTKWAPWYVVPADHKWFSRVATAAVLVTALDAINPRYPAPDPPVADQMAQVRGELATELGRTGPD